MPFRLKKPANNLLERWAEVVSDGLVGVADPCDGGGGVEGCLERLAGKGIFEEDACFLGEETGGEVVGMGSEAGRQTQFAEGERAQIGDEAIMADQEFIELAPGGEVLVVKDQRGAAGAVGINTVPKFFLEVAEDCEPIGEKAGNGSESVATIGGAAGTEPKRLAGSGTDIECFGVQALSANGAQLVATPLAGSGELRHGGDGDVVQTGMGTFLGGEAGEGPCGALVEHEIPRTIDRIHD